MQSLVHCVVVQVVVVVVVLEVVVVVVVIVAVVVAAVVVIVYLLTLPTSRVRKSLVSRAPPQLRSRRVDST